MADTIPATNKWLLTKQASVERSAEQWQACDDAEQTQGSSASRVAGGPHWHGSRWRWLGKETGGCWRTKQRRRQAEEEKKMMKEPWARLGTRVSTNAWTVQTRLSIRTLWSSCLAAFIPSVFALIQLAVNCAGQVTGTPKWGPGTLCCPNSPMTFTAIVFNTAGSFSLFPMH